MSSTSSHIRHHQNNINNNIVGMNISCNNNSNTTFVQADPSNFRSVVQKLTGHHDSDKLRKSTFKLHQRRQSATKIENIFTGNKKTIMSTRHTISTSSFLASPVSPLEMMTRGTNLRSSMEKEEEEERAIGEKFFYLHPNTPRASTPPKLLPLFPLQSPSAAHHSSS